MPNPYRDGYKISGIRSGLNTHASRPRYTHKHDHGSVRKLRIFPVCVASALNDCPGWIATALTDTANDIGYSCSLQAETATGLRLVCAARTALGHRHHVFGRYRA
ncbi:hypothetical protein D3C80_1371740 [compost metagenome]